MSPSAMRRISFKLFAEHWKVALRCLMLAKGFGILRILRILRLKPTWVPTGRMPNIPGPVSGGSRQIPLHEGNLAGPDLASSNTSSPYVSQFIPSIRKYIEHIAQTTHLPTEMHSVVSYSCRFETHMPPQSQSQYIWIILPQSSSRHTLHSWTKSK